jgi:ribose-phosphate pyrophosphokinase
LNIPIFPRFINALNLESLTLLDVHTPELLDMISIPTTHLSAMDMFKDHILEKFSKEHALIVSPDRGGKNRVDYLCQVTGFSKVYMDKQRINGQIHSQLEQGSVSGKVCVLVDDVIDSGQTILKAACVLREKGAREVHVYATHGVFSTLPFSSIEWQNLNSITVTDSCPPVVGVNILSISPLLEHIERRLFFEYNVFKKAQQSQWF